MFIALCILSLAVFCLLAYCISLHIDIRNLRYDSDRHTVQLGKVQTISQDLTAFKTRFVNFLDTHEFDAREFRVEISAIQGAVQHLMGDLRVEDLPLPDDYDEIPEEYGLDPGGTTIESMYGGQG